MRSQKAHKSSLSKKENSALASRQPTSWSDYMQRQVTYTFPQTEKERSGKNSMLALSPDHQEEPRMNSVLPTRNQSMLALTTRKNQGWTLSCQPGIRACWPWPPGRTRDELCLANQESEDDWTMLKLKKAPGPHNTTNETLLHIGPCSKKKLLQLFNDGWRTGTVPKSEEKPSWFLYSRESRTSHRLKATNQSALPVVWENWSTTLSTCKAANTGETKNVTSFGTAGPLTGETELQDHMP